MLFSDITNPVTDMYTEGGKGAQAGVKFSLSPAPWRITPLHQCQYLATLPAVVLPVDEGEPLIAELAGRHVSIRYPHGSPGSQPCPIGKLGLWNENEKFGMLL